MSIEAADRLRVWIRDYGHEKQPAFIEDLTAVLDENDRLAAFVRSILPTPEVAEAMKRLKKYGAGKEPYKDGRQVLEDQQIILNHFLTALESQ